jgi:hypothetical protein
MVVAGKIFRISQPISLANLAEKIKGYKVEEPFEEGDYKFTLITEVTNLQVKAALVSGVFSHDYITHVYHRGTSAPIPHTVEAAFSFATVQRQTFLTVVEKKRVANQIANNLSEILFEKVGAILNVRIQPEVLKDFHNRNPEDTKITFFDEMDIPNVDKLSLYGPDLNSTSVFEDYMKHGSLWYVVAKSKDTGYVVGITREASVTIFNLTDKAKYVEYVAKEIYPIILTTAK